MACDEQYFEEAHRCDLAGLKIATAVLCRAVLERALVQVVDPLRKIKYKRGEESYIGLMLVAAQRNGRLDEERKKAGMKIKDAGDAAIHDLKKFRKDYGGRMNEIVDNTRKILTDLYS